MNTLLNNPKHNIIAIIITEIITLTITFTANYNYTGIEGVLVKWTPAFIGLFTLIIYFISRFIFKKYNWLISLAGIIFMVFAAVKIYTLNFS
ncbi:hypothetical protein [Lacinutrix sp. MedPE-SW]|uniref:hypothetical protein n=1 Tax=Lacinutrix sp. MedPE-SW TaxID=1860087 RepID=UPI0009153FC8|nr:hypothetical protein [Lacinutrix sp. MedPE-SW]OIQ23972.1 MAG: hypothetical protein BM549_01295 [Lacinutrix sp. MedPE-SW]